jgi:hypothetical protein
MNNKSCMSRQIHVRICESVAVKLHLDTRPPTESFFHSLKIELIYFENYKIREEAKKSAFEYIEVFCT